MKGARVYLVLIFTLLCAGLSSLAFAQVDARPQAETGQAVGKVTPDRAGSCLDLGITGDGQLPNLRKALQSGNAVRILSIGASSFAGTRSGMEGADAQLAQILSDAVSGLRVTIVNRGVSGELARQAAERIKLEVALEDPILVLWQVGTADAFARIPIADFEATLRNTVKWLKARKVDVVLVSLHYVRQWTRDEYVQAMRRAVRRVTTEERVMRIGRYEAEEVIARAARDGRGQRPDDFTLTEAGYDCMAGYVARAIAVGLYAKRGAQSSPVGKSP